MAQEITKELIQKAKQARSAEEFKAVTKENGIDLTDEQAAVLFSKLNACGELTDEELNAVAGGVVRLASDDLRKAIEALSNK